MADKPLKLHYFALAGRGEPTRLALTVGGVPYEDVLYTRETWGAAKATTPFGQLPYLELPDGRKLAQSGAVLRYAAKLGKLYPEDAWVAAKADEAIFLLADLMQHFSLTSSISDAAEKIKARTELLAEGGKAREGLNQLSQLIQAAGGSYVAGGKLSFADLEIFCGLCGLTSGFWDGVPATLYDAYPVLKAYRNNIASLPAIKSHYAKVTDGSRDAFKPDV